jgi:hypothetical protein
MRRLEVFHLNLLATILLVSVVKSGAVSNRTGEAHGAEDRDHARQRPRQSSGRPNRGPAA